ncbi:MAG: type 1 glutamine amidotransferase, partial [cyanobacterium endosymbiont of Rhopalodia inflata]
MFKTKELRIGWLYPTLMSTYGDRGNVICLQRRCQWRGLNVTIVPITQETEASIFKQIDIIVGGGAQDRQQEIVMRDLRGAKAEAFKNKVEEGTPGVFTCGSPQLLGHYYEPALGRRIEGLGLLDLVSKHSGANVSRCIGDV